MNLDLNFSDEHTAFKDKVIISSKDILHPCNKENSLKELENPNLFQTTAEHQQNAISTTSISTVLVGDLFYDESIICRLYRFLCNLKAKYIQTKVLIGDPGRPFLRTHPIFKKLSIVAEYPLPQESMDHGFTSGSVHEFKI